MADGEDDEKLEIDEPGGEEESEGCGDGDEAEAFRFFRFDHDVHGEEDCEIVDGSEERDGNAHDRGVFAFCNEIAAVGDGAGKSELGVVLDC